MELVHMCLLGISIIKQINEMHVNIGSYLNLDESGVPINLGKK